MKNIAFLLFLLFFQITVFSQQTNEDRLVEALIDYKNTDEFKDNLKFTQNLSKLNDAIEKSILSENILNYKNFKEVADRLDVQFVVKNSEENNILLFTMTDDFFHWNYLIKNNQVILKDHKSHEYFTQIHALSTHEFLLIEQQDDLVFSCNYAYVYMKSGNSFIRKRAFGNKDKLAVCNFTQVDNSPLKEPDHFSVPVRKIVFNYNNKTISYGNCINHQTGKTKVGKSKYIMSNFRIDDCDERKDFD